MAAEADSWKGHCVPDTLDTRDRLTRVETKLDVLIDHLERSHIDHEGRLRALESSDPTKTLEDHEDRLRSLEKTRWIVAGFAAAGGGGLATLVQALMGG